MTNIRFKPQMPGLQLRKRAIQFTVVSYFVLLVLVFANYDNDTVPEATLFVLINLVVAIVFIVFENVKFDKLFSYLIYIVYTFSYIFKAIIINILDINSYYIDTTIRVTIAPDDYISSLYIVTYGHMMLVCLLFLFSTLPQKRFVDLSSKMYIETSRLNMVMLFVLLWIILSSITMYSYGVAVMGTEGVSLPYKLSGIFFYSRTIIIPTLLLYAIEKAMVQGDYALLRKALFIYLLLALSEIIVRASKEPLLNMVLFIGVLAYMLLINGILVRKYLHVKYLLVGLLIAIVAFPIVTVYREIIVGGGLESFRNVTEIVESTESSLQYQGDYFMQALTDFFHRLVGFTQMAGIVAMHHSSADYFNIIEYGGIAQYYTEQILNYFIPGHLSSPSLIGSAILLAGATWWPIVFISYISIMAIVWRYSSSAYNLGLVVKCLLSYEVFNTIIAGTIDASFLRLFFLFFFVLIFELVFSINITQRNRINVFR